MFCINFPTYGLDRQLYYTQKARVGLPHSAADNRSIITDITFWYQTTVFGVTQLTSTE